MLLMFPAWQVLENTEGGTEGSLMSALDMCATVMGKRRLRAWLCRPMARIADIAERQDAVADLMGPAAQAAQAARDALSGGRTFHAMSLCSALTTAVIVAVPGSLWCQLPSH